MIYHAYQAHVDAMWPLRKASRAAAPILMATQRPLAVACEVFNLAEVTHERPDWAIDEAIVDGVPVPVVEETVQVTAFATLRRFRKRSSAAGPRVLLVAPMSGHFATLLRDTARTLLADHDVHVTDWHNARDVPCGAGRFGLDEYIAHLIGFLEAMGPGAHVVAVCQPCVAALAATALMAADAHPATPASLTLMAGPIDCRVRPTAVNRLASSRPIDWFARHLIDVVPWCHGGAGRRVYPGFVQLGAFMNMNRERHLRAFHEYHERLLADDQDKARAIRSFYQEYFAVSDLPAEFYLETVEQVFQAHALPTGALRWRGRHIEPAAIERTALLTVEGERDDICAVGQTLAAQELCSGLAPFRRTHFVQPDVGHYGVFSGRRWQQHIYPVVREVIHGAGG